MGTSRSDDERPGAAGSGGARLASDGGAPGGDPRDSHVESTDLRIPDSASSEEAAAIAAAIESYVATQRAAAAERAGDTRPWAGRRWAFAGRLGNLTGQASRVPEGAPDDGWSALGRVDRF